jgi:hypothetical protein
VPDPKFHIAGRSESFSVKRSELALISGLGAMALGFDFDVPFQVVSFTVSFTVEGKLHEFVMTGIQLNEEVRANLKQADVGKKIWLEGKVRCPDGSIRTLNPIHINLRE